MTARLAETMPAAAPLRLAAAAKLNLYLHVVGRRPDGYHELDSLVAFADVRDTIEIRPAVGFSLRLDGPFGVLLDGDPAGNLVARAAHGLAAALGRTADVAVTLTKRLPIASGIGGGSADAAACLRGLALLWRLDPDDPRPLAVAAVLGADIPVCVAGKAAYLGGIGERLDPAPVLPPCHAVLVNPGLPLPTPSVFRARTGGFSDPARFDRAPRDAADLAALLATRRNDLDPPARALAPVIATVLEALAATPGCLLARLSGSGATCFALYPDADAAGIAAAGIAAAHPDWWSRAARLVADTALLDRAEQETAGQDA